MAEEDLLGGAVAEPEADKTPEQTDVSHLETPAEKPAVNFDDAAMLADVSKFIRTEDGKPNYADIPEKFWKDGKPNLKALATARAELEKKFSRGDHKAPAEYDLGLIKEAGVAEDDPMVGAYKQWAKENGVSQDAFNKLAANYIETQKAQADQFTINVQAEKAKLGPQAEKIIGTQVAFAQSLVKRGVFSADDFNEFKVMGGTAAGLQVFMKLQEYYGDMKRIPVDVAATSSQPSRQDLQDMVADPRYESDASYRRKVEAAFEEAYKDQ